MYTRGHAAVVRERFVGDVHRPLADAWNGDLGLVERVRALWSLEGAPANTLVDDVQLPSTKLPLLSLVGSLLSHPHPMLAREACELLCHLALPDAPGEFSIAVGVTKSGALAVSPRSFFACEPTADHKAWCPDLDVEVVRLVDVHRLSHKLAAPLALLHGVDGGKASTLVVVAGHRLVRVRRAGRIGLEAHAPLAITAGAGAFSLRATAPFFVDGERVDEAVVHGQHDLRWGDVTAQLSVVPSLSDHQRVLVEVPDGGFDGVAVGDAWFSRLKLARGHIAFTTDKRALVVDLTSSPSVSLLAPGDATSFGAYDAEYLANAGVLRITARTSTGPDRARPAVRQAASSAKRAA
jgi:hypothetical protein